MCPTCYIFGCSGTEELVVRVCSSVESPSTSSEHVNEALAAARYDSDLEVEELPPLKQVLGEDVCKKLKPKEKKRQEVINGESVAHRRHQAGSPVGIRFEKIFFYTAVMW